MSDQNELRAAAERGQGGEIERLEAGATGGPASDQPLLAPQMRAIELLATGKSIAEAARLSGIGRTTLFRWLKSDAVFRAALNQWQSELQSSGQARLLALTDKAVDAVGKALEKGDAKSAIQLLKGMGILKETVVGPTDAEEMKNELEIEEKRRRGSQFRRELMSGLGD